MRLVGPKSIPYEELLGEACKVELAWRDINRPERYKLTEQAWIARANAIAEMTVEEVGTFTHDVDTQKRFADCRFWLSHAVKPILEGGWVWPTDELDRLENILPTSRDVVDRARAELAAVGRNFYALQAVAARKAAEAAKAGKGGSFGTTTSIEDWRARKTDLEGRRGELRDRLGREWSPQDLHEDDARTGKFTLAVTGGAVPVHPTANLGERITNWALTEPALLRRVGVKV